MHASLRTPLALLVVLLACDSGTPEAGGKAAVSADVKADAAVQLDTKAVAQAAAHVDAPAKVAVDATATAVAVATPPALKAVADVEAALGGELVLRAADLDLRGVVDLVAAGKLHSAAEIELFLNAPDAAAHRVDIDADGKLDYLQVVELRVGAAVNLELRAIPSSKLDASLAVLVATLSTARADGAIKLAASYGAAVEGGADFHVEHDLKADVNAGAGAAVVADASAGAFAGWALNASRTPHISVHLSPVDISVGADGAAQFVGDASASLDAARLAALRAALKVEVLAAVEPPKVSVKTGAKATGGVKVDHSAKADSSVKVGSSGGVKVGGGGVSVGGSAGVSIGGSAGVSVGGGGKGKAGAGIKIGR